MNWSSILNGVVEGLTTALVWALLLWFWQLVKMYKIRFKIRKSIIDTKSFFYQRPNYFGIVLKNTSAWPVIIRGVRFVLDSVEVQCGYLGRKESEYDEHILLKSKTDDRWGCPINLLNDVIKEAWVEYEYDTLLGQSKVERVKIADEATCILEDSRQQIRKGLEGRSNSHFDT